MQTTVAHQLMLLALDDATGEPVDGSVLHYIIAGGVVAELLLRGRLVPSGGGRYGVTGQASTSPILREAESWFPAGDQTLAAYISIIADKSEVRKMVTSELVSAGALRIEREEGWFTPRRTRWPAADGASEQSLVQHLRTWLADVAPDAPPGRDDMLLSLLRAGELLGTVWTGDELATVGPKIRQRAELVPIGRSLGEVVSAAGAAATSILSM